jgi:hypothetical protein
MLEKRLQKIDGYRVKVRCREKICDLLAKTKPRLLSNLGGQERFLLQMALTSQDCIHPECDHRFNQLEACKEDVYDLGSVNNTFACPECKQVCRVVVPFWNFGNPWHWGKPAH